jgi:hypothetical protein
MSGGSGWCQRPLSVKVAVSSMWQRFRQPLVSFLSPEVMARLNRRIREKLGNGVLVPFCSRVLVEKARFPPRNA